MTIKSILLNNISEGMILAQDVVDKYGRILIASGIPLKQEILKLLEKHGVISVFIREPESINFQIESTPDVASMEIRLKLISSVNDAFSKTRGQQNDRVVLSKDVEDGISLKLSECMLAKNLLQKGGQSSDSWSNLS